eukprot:523041-Alexandrium_andersonii.AAC.1
MEASKAATSRGPSCPPWDRKQRRSSHAAWQMRQRGPIAKHRWVVWRPHSRQSLGGRSTGPAPPRPPDQEGTQ